MFDNHKVVFKALVGSHNYNLNDETSDKDWKYFVLPTFDDLYEGKYFSISKVRTEEDYTVHDIRKLAQLFWKANINFLEILYSKELDVFPSINPYGDSCDNDLDSLALAGEIFSMREELVTLNLPYLYNACKGMYFEKMKRLTKGTEGTQHLVDKYGYDTKQALHAIRVLNFCIDFAQGGFKDFSKSLTYDYSGRYYMLTIKNGEYSLDKFREIAEEKYNMFLQYESFYKQQEPNEETKANLESLIKELVRRNIC